ncbi:arylsulfatase K-like [Glandiceps talaboti]
MMEPCKTSISVAVLFVIATVLQVAAKAYPFHKFQKSLETKPGNILFIICDAMDGRLIGNDNTALTMEHINGRLVSNGVTFTNAYTNSPICCPSRSALWSGLHTHITESWNNFKGLPDSFPTWKDSLDAGGYDTKILGKTDYTSGDHSVSNRVEAWTRDVNFTLAQEGRPTPVLVGDEETRRIELSDWKNVDKAKEWLKNRTPSQDKPFLLYIGINLPHPYKTSQEGPHAGGSTFKTSPYWLKHVDMSKVTIPKWTPLDEMHPVDYYETATKNCTSHFTEDEIRKVRAYYYGMCAEVDGMVGELLDQLDSSGFTNSTYIIFTSDHGDLAMEHRQFYKMSMYEGSSHVPLIVTSPTHKLNIKVKDPVSLVDIFPTLMDMAEILSPPGLNGSSLMPYLGMTTANQDRPDWVLSQYHGCNVNMSTYMLRMGDWKYVAFGNGNQVSPHLFNLAEGTDELYDYAAERPDIVNMMDIKLRTVIDYPQVSQQVKKYNKDSFMSWKKTLGDKYSETIANLRWFMDFQKDAKRNEQKIQEWLDAPM